MSTPQPLPDQTSAPATKNAAVSKPEPETLYTPQEYLRRERTATTKSEYVNGRMLAMAGASLPHIAAASDMHTAFGNRFQTVRNGCEVYNNDLKVRVGKIGPYFYPDVTVICGEPDVDKDGCVSNPILIVEVLSPSTENNDRGMKFRHYRAIPSLRHYILIDISEVLVEHFARQAEGNWLLAGEHSDLENVLTIPDLDLQIPLREIYRRVPIIPPPPVPVEDGESGRV